MPEPLTELQPSIKSVKVEVGMCQQSAKGFPGGEG